MSQDLDSVLWRQTRRQVFSLSSFSSVYSYHCVPLCRDTRSFYGRTLSLFICDAISIIVLLHLTLARADAGCFVHSFGWFVTTGTCLKLMFCVVLGNEESNRKTLLTKKVDCEQCVSLGFKWNIYREKTVPSVWNAIPGRIRLQRESQILFTLNKNFIWSTEQGVWEKTQYLEPRKIFNCY